MNVERLPLPVRAELVEAPPVSCARSKEEKQGFDKLSPNGFGDRSVPCS